MEIDGSEAKDRDMTVMREAIISHLASSDEIVLKSQQKGEPDLTVQEKRDLVQQCLTLSQPHNFLSRFNTYMEPRHLQYFKRLYPQCDYEVSFYLRENSVKKSETVVKNRRLEALRRLAVEGEYFSEEEMRRRDPLLYEHLVGRYLTDQQRSRNYFSHAKNSEESCKLSTLLLEQEERVRADNLMKEQEKDEEEIETSSDEELDDNNDGSSSASRSRTKDDRAPLLRLWGESCSSLNRIEVSRRVTDDEKRLMFEEFRSHMYRQFLGGKDKDFDYYNVDMNTDYDDLDKMGQDAEDKYFDSESPEDLEMEGLNDTITGTCDNRVSVETTGGLQLESKPGRDAQPSQPHDDPLDAFMSQLQHNQIRLEISAKMRNTYI